MTNAAQKMLNNGIRKAIDEFDFDQARQSLKTALELDPDVTIVVRGTTRGQGNNAQY